MHHMRRDQERFGKRRQEFLGNQPAVLALLDAEQRRHEFVERFVAVDRAQALAQRLGSVNRGPGKLPPPHDDVRIDLWGQSREDWLARRAMRGDVA